MLRTIRNVKRALAMLGVVVSVQGAGMVAAHAADPLPLPIDSNCGISYGVGLRQISATQDQIHRYSGSTSCSSAIASISAYVTLSHAGGAQVQHGPFRTCTNCSGLGSTGGPYGPVSIGSAWKVDYYTEMTLKSSENWAASTPENCGKSGKTMTCHEELLFAPVATSTSSDLNIDLSDIAIAT